MGLLTKRGSLNCSTIMANWLDDQNNKTQENSPNEIGDFFHNLTSLSKTRAESERELESILRFYSSTIYKYISGFIEDVKNLKIKQSAIEKERDKLLETVSKQSNKIALLKAKLPMVQDVEEDPGQ